MSVANPYVGDLDQILSDALRAYRALDYRDPHEDEAWIAAVTTIAHVIHRRAVRLSGQQVATLDLTELTDRLRKELE